MLWKSIKRYTNEYMKKYIHYIISVTLAIASFVPGIANADWTLTNFNHVPASYEAGAITSYTYTFVNDTTLLGSRSDLFVIIYPEGYDVSNVTTNTLSLILNGDKNNIVSTGLSSVNIPTRTVSVVTTADIPSGSNVEIIVSGVQNPVTPGIYEFTPWVNFYSQIGGGGTVDAPDAMPDISITEAAPDYSSLFAGGNGSLSTPFLIETLEQFQAIKQIEDALAGSTAPFIFILNADITLEEGYEEFDFYGSLDGEDHVITTNYGPIFSTLYGNITKFEVDGAITDSEGPVGMVARTQATGSIDNVEASGSIAVTNGECTNIGGLVGISFANINNARSSVTIDSDCMNVGGLVGNLAATGVITNSYAAGNVSGYTNVGGFVGSQSGTIETSYAFGDVTATGNNIGGFAGFMGYNAETVNAYTRGDVIIQGTSLDSIGGFAGKNEGGDIFNVYATGTIQLPADADISRVGGFIGAKVGDSVYSSFSTGVIVNHQDATAVGSFIGFNEFNPGQYNVGYWTGTGPTLAISNQEAAVLAYPESSVLAFKSIDHPIYAYNAEIDGFDGEKYGGRWDYISLWEINEDNDEYPHFIWQTVFPLEEDNNDEEDNEDPEPNPTPTRRRSSGGQASAAYLAQLGITLANQVTAPATPTSNTCPADQLLTQNLRTGARNGRFHPYTGGIVTQANILQAHLNRLGFNSGPVDGILGPISDGAIKRMQTFLGTKADGFVGPITRGLLNASCGSAGLQQ